MKRKGISIAQTLIMLMVLAILAACEQPTNTLPTSTSAAAGEMPPLNPTDPPVLEPQVVLLRGAQGCDHHQSVISNRPLQLHYGVWGSIGLAYAEASWELIDVTLTIDGDEVQGEKQPVAADLVSHCGGDAEGTYWLFFIAYIESIPPGVHQLEVTYYANGEIDDGSGQIRGPGTFLTNSFTLNSTDIADDVIDASIPSAPRVERFADNPIIIPEMLPGHGGENINGPSLIRVPDWVEDPLGRYYLYFAHHIGSYIRMAYADDLAGPWTVYDPGTLRLEDTICDDITGSIYVDYKHVASPDVHVDPESRQIRMYFHCPVYISGPRDSDDSHAQVTLVATSSDGLNFEAASEHLGNAYFRVFQAAGQTYALSMPGTFYRSDDGLSGFEAGPTLFSENMRHSAVTIRDEQLLVFYTMVGDNPERILLSTIELLPDWMTWSATEPVVVLEPELDWEGVHLPLEPSYRGWAPDPVRQLRDPAIFVDEGPTYLLNSVAGELGIAMAELHWR